MPYWESLGLGQAETNKQCTTLSKKCRHKTVEMLTGLGVSQPRTGHKLATSKQSKTQSIKINVHLRGTVNFKGVDGDHIELHVFTKRLNYAAKYNGSRIRMRTLANPQQRAARKNQNCGTKPVHIFTSMPAPFT